MVMLIFYLQLNNFPFLAPRSLGKITGKVSVIPLYPVGSVSKEAAMGSRSECIKEIAAKINDNPQLIQRLKSLDQACSKIEEYYHEYDYQDVPCNGFRSFVKIVESYLHQLLQFTEQAGLDKKTVTEYDTLSQLMCINAEAAAMIRKKGHDYPLQVTDDDCEIMEKFSVIEPKHMEPLYGSVGPFYVRSGFKAAMKKIVTVIGFFGADTLIKKLRFLLSPSYRISFLADISVNWDLKNASAVGFMDKFPLNLLMEWLNRPVGCSTKWFTVPRDFSDWQIRLPDLKAAAVIEMRKHEVHTRKPMNCLVFTPKAGTVKEKKSLLIHFPGGGFFISKAAPYIKLMSRVCRELGVTIVLPEYSLTPQHPYPAAIQDLLDLYCFLLSGDQKVYDMVGFQPEEIVISGDSAGGQLATALTITLNEIRRKGGAVRMPKALTIQYPGAIVGFVAYPGVILSGLDMCATVGQLRVATLLYAQTDPPIDPNDLDLHNKDKKYQFEVVKRHNDRLKDPLYNPIVYDHYEDMRDIPISIFACEMDSIMDHSIYIANKWRGPVTLDIGRGLPHGFTAAASAISVQEEVRLLIQRYASALTGAPSNPHG